MDFYYYGFSHFLYVSLIFVIYHIAALLYWIGPWKIATHLFNYHFKISMLEEKFIIKNIYHFIYILWSKFDSEQKIIPVNFYKNA